MDDGPPDGASWQERGPWGDGRSRRPVPPGAGQLSGAAAWIGRLTGGGGGAAGDGPPVRAAWRWGMVAIAILWIVLTSAHTIGPQQRGIVTRFGRYIGTREPGLSMTLPAPIDIVRKVDVDRIQEIDIDRPGGGETPARSAIASGDDQNLMLTGDENLIDLAYSVRWSIRDPELYLFELADPRRTIREVAESAMREAVARIALTDAMGPQRGRIETDVAARMQAVLDSYRSGIVVRGVAIRQADPPAEVMDAFKEVSAAQQQAQSYLNQARTYATQIVARASGEAVAFDKVYAQYRLSPEVTRRRLYYETMEKVLAKTDKIVIQAPGVTPYLPLQPKAAK